jgi:hypothetical protein
MQQFTRGLAWFEQPAKKRPGFRSLTLIRIITIGQQLFPAFRRFTLRRANYLGIIGYRVAVG